MEIRIEQSYPVTKAVLEIENGKWTSIRFHLLQTAPVSSDQLFGWCASGRQGSFTFKNRELSFTVTGYQFIEAAGAFELIVTPLGRTAWNWFSERFTASAPMLLYQRQNSNVDPNAWDFLRRMLDFKLFESAGNFSERVGSMLPEHVCFPRFAGWSNLDLLEHLLAYLDERIPQVMGWAAFQRDQPLQFITNAGQPQELDETWRLGDEGCQPSRPGNDTRFTQMSLTHDFHPSHAGQLCQGLSSRGRAGTLAEFGLSETKELQQLVPAPGLVRYRDKTYFCQLAEYTFRSEHDVVAAELQFGLKPSLPKSWPHGKVSSQFWRWEASDSGVKNRVAVKPTGNHFVVIGRDSNPNPDLPLWAEVLMPVVARKDHAGLYCKYKSDDPMQITIEPGATPDLRGHRQSFQPELEKVDVSLNASTLGLQTSSAVTAIDNADGIHLNGPGQAVVIQTDSGKNQLKVQGSDRVHFSQNVRIDKTLDVD